MTSQAPLAALLAAAACAPTLKVARRTADEPPSDREKAAQGRVEHAKCAPAVGVLFPGVGQVCHSQTAEGITLAGLGATELGLGLGVLTKHDLSYPAALYPLVAVQDLWLLSITDVQLDVQRAHEVPFTPQDSHEEMLGAPFNVRVLTEPFVWGGLLGLVALNTGVIALEGPLSTGAFLSRPNVFGFYPPPALGYAAGAAAFAFLFEHVALAEESFFRGYVQSSLAWRLGETKGWIYGSLLFGLVHASNALFLPSNQRVQYVLLDVPVITVIGSYLGLLYRHFGYSLVPSTAVHFWYDFLVSMEDLFLNPQMSSIAGRLIRLP
jgi:membrane protease YdiL (CAAX protease family)